MTDPATFQAPASATAPSTPSTTSAGNRSLEGVWEADLSRGEIARALTEGGFSGLAQRFFVSEEIPDDGIRTRSTFRDGQFTQAYRGPDGTWQVGWEADLDTAGDRVEVIDEATAGTDTLRWRVEDGRVRFIPVETTSPMYKGIPRDGRTCGPTSPPTRTGAWSERRRGARRSWTAMRSSGGSSSRVPLGGAHHLPRAPRPARAEEIAQDSFVQLLRHWDKVRHYESPRRGSAGRHPVGRARTRRRAPANGSC